MINPRVFIQTIITLASASLGFVAALAWNAAIKASILSVLGKDDSLMGLYIYAMIATVLAVTVVSVLARIASRLGGRSVIRREVNAD